MYCSKCGSKVPDGNKFCNVCGAPLEQSFEQPAQNSASSPSHPVAAPVAAPTAPKGRKGRSPMPIVAVVAALAVVGVIVAVVLGLFSGGKTGLRLDEETFPDSAFRTILQESADTDADGTLSPEEVEAVTSIELANVFDITGIERLTSLKDLSFSGETAGSFELASLDTIESIDVSAANSLQSLTISSMPVLAAVNCNGSAALQTVAVAEAPALQSMSCSGATALTQVSLEQAPALERVDCSNASSLQTVVLSDVPALTSLDVSGTSVEILELPEGNNVSELRLAPHTVATNICDAAKTAYLMPTSLTYDMEGPMGIKAHIAITASYDEMGRISSKRISGSGSFAPGNPVDYGNVDYAYDERGRLSTVTVSGHSGIYDKSIDGVWTLAYSDDGRTMTATKDCSARGESTAPRFTETYDESGRLISRSSNLNEITFSYDEKGRLAAFAFVTPGQDGGDSRVPITYDENDRIASISYSDETYIFDANGSIVAMDRNGNRTNTNLQYSEDGLISSMGFSGAYVAGGSAEATISRDGNTISASYGRSGNSDMPVSWSVTYEEVLAAPNVIPYPAVDLSDPTLITPQPFYADAWLSEPGMASYARNPTICEIIQMNRQWLAEHAQADSEASTTAEQENVPTEQGGVEDAANASIPTFVSDRSISAGALHTVGLRSDGTVIAVGGENIDEESGLPDNPGMCDVSDWKDIVAVSAGLGYTVGLRSDGTVVTAGTLGQLNAGQTNVTGWTNIKAIATGFVHTIGLRSDGTVVAVGWNDSGQCDVSEWTDIVAVSAGSKHTVGLRSDGTVFATGDNSYGQCDVSSWTDIIAISAGYDRTVGLRSDGTVVSAGHDERSSYDVSDWSDIVAVSAGSGFTVGLRSDGSVITTVEGAFGKHKVSLDVSSWKDIVAISAGNEHIVGLRSDGTVVAVGSNSNGQCNVAFWELN